MAGWLTARRLRAHGTILALCLWSLYIWNVATPTLRDRSGNLKGTDFLHFYTLGSLALEHNGADLYDMKAQAAVAVERVPDAAGIRYLPLYPPQVSILFAPFALLPYAWALSLWWLLNSAAYAACCYAVFRACPNLQRFGGTAVVLAVAYPAFFHLIAWGQTSGLALISFTAMFFLLNSRREFSAGMALGLLIFKPQLGLVAAILFLSVGAWKVLAGALASASAELAAGVLYYGTGPLREWIHVLWNLPVLMRSLEPKPYQTHSLRSFWSMLLPWSRVSLSLYVISGVIVLALTVACWRRRSLPLSVRYSSLLFASVLVAPHLTVYDLVILVPAIFLLSDWLVGQEPGRMTWWVGTLLYLVYALPLLGPVTRYTHVQLSVIAMAAVLYLVWRSSGAARTLSDDVSAAAALRG